MPNTTAPLAAVGDTAPIAAVVADWIVPGTGPSPQEQVTAILQAATTTAHRLATHPVAAVVLEPGNGWAYRIVVTRLDRPTAEKFGGDTLISLTEFHRSTLLNFGGGYHVPGYIGEKLDLGAIHDGVIAAFTTLLDNRLNP